MPKIVVLGSCRFQPYIFLAVPEKNEKWNTEEGYEESTKKFYPAIDQADEVWVYAPDGIGEHTARDLDYAVNLGKTIRFIADSGGAINDYESSARICYSCSHFNTCYIRKPLDDLHVLSEILITKCRFFLMAKEEAEEENEEAEE